MQNLSFSLPAAQNFRKQNFLIFNMGSPQRVKIYCMKKSRLMDLEFFDCCHPLSKNPAYATDPSP